MSELNLLGFVWMGAGHSPTPWVLSMASGLAEWVPFLCAAALCVAFVACPGERWRLVAALVLSGVGVQVAHWIAELLGMPRPFMLGLSPAHVPHGARGSLPSAHATAMFVLVFSAAASAPLRMLAVVLLAGTLVTSWTRIYLGLHFPADIVAGALLASLLVGGQRFIWQRWSSILRTERPMTWGQARR